MVFSSKVSPETLAHTIRSISDPIQDCAETLRNLLNETDFGLQDRFYDVNDLENSIEHIRNMNII